MTRTAVLLLAFALLASLVAAHQHPMDMADEEVDDILPSDWSEKVPDELHSGHQGDGCVHEQVIKNLRTTHKPVYAPQEYDTNAAAAGNLTAAGSRKLLLSGANYIRVYFDTSAIDNYDAKACNSVGQVLTTMNPSYTCQQKDIMDNSKRSYLKNTLLPAAKAWIEGAFKLQRVSGNLKFSSSTDCYQAPVSSVYSSSGVPNADLVLFVTGRPTSGSALAWAANCRLDQNKRPVAGHINFGPANLNPDMSVRSQQVGVAIHEIGHVQGFSGYFFDKFVDPNTKQVLPKSQVLKEGTLWSSQHQVKWVQTPKVREEAGKFFGCSNTPGLQLEDGGTSGSAGSHWDKRLMQDDYMNPTAMWKPVYSRITFAFFEDTGHYEMDYGSAEASKWGQGMGCDFMTKSCGQWPSSWGYTCSDPNAKPCTGDRTAKGYCSLVTYSADLPSYFQYFSNPKMGGGDKFSDYCPLVRAYSNGDCTDTGNSGPSAGAFGENYGADGMCVMGSTMKSGYVNNGVPRASCVIKRCSNGVLQLKVGSSWVTCPASGGSVSAPSGFTGSITCPTYAQVCTGSSSSSGGGSNNNGGGSGSSSLGAYLSPSSSVSVRSGPGTSYSLLWTAEQSDVFIKLSTVGDWVRVQSLGGPNDGKNAYVHGGYLTTVALVCPSLDGLNMRSGPGTSYTRIFEAGPADSFLVLSSSGSWKRLRAVSSPRTGTYAWASSSYLRSCSPAPKSTPTGSGSGSATSSTGVYWISQVNSISVERVDQTSSGSFSTLSGTVDKFCLMTLENRWPSAGEYEAGKSVFSRARKYPHFLVAKDSSGRTRIAQFLPLNKAGSMFSSSSANNDGVIQVMVGAKASSPFTSNDWSLKEAVKGLYKAVSDATGMPIRVDSRVKFVQDGAYGRNAPQRLSSSDYSSVSGIIGRQHVPGETMWDPGMIDPQRLM